jgi:hypothetical protein
MTSLNLMLASVAYSAHNRPMGEGRLIRVRKYRGDPKPVAYVVAEPDKAKAMDIIREGVEGSGLELEDVGRVSDALLTAMSLASGQFVRIDGVQHVAQQQQQPQSKKE